MRRIAEASLPILVLILMQISYDAWMQSLNRQVESGTRHLTFHESWASDVAKNHESDLKSYSKEFRAMTQWGVAIFLLLGFMAGILNVLRSAGMVAEHGTRKPPGKDGSG